MALIQVCIDVNMTTAQKKTNKSASVCSCVPSYVAKKMYNTMSRTCLAPNDHQLVRGINCVIVQPKLVHHFKVDMFQELPTESIKAELLYSQCQQNNVPWVPLVNQMYSGLTSPM